MSKNNQSTQRSRSFCFTINNPKVGNGGSLSTYFNDVIPKCKYLVYQVESGKKHTKHLQGYIYFKSKKSFGQVKKLLGSVAHIEHARGSAKQNRDYCTKVESRLEGPWEFGKMPKQGKRNDLLKAKRMIDKGKSEKQIADKIFGTYVRYYKGLNRYRLLVTKKRNFKTRVVYIYGETGVGKSKFAHTFQHAFWKQSGNKWFDSYEGEDVVIFDDMNKAWFTFDTFKRMLDRYPMQVETKGGSVNFAPHTIIITSNVHPREIYHKYFKFRPSALEELNRRLDIIIKMDRGGKCTFIKNNEDEVLTQIRTEIKLRRLPKRKLPSTKSQPKSKKQKLMDEQILKDIEINSSYSSDNTQSINSFCDSHGEYLFE